MFHTRESTKKASDKLIKITMENGIRESHLSRPMVFQFALLSFYWELEWTENPWLGWM